MVEVENKSRPRVVVLVDNTLQGDSRVMKQVRLLSSMRVDATVLALSTGVSYNAMRHGVTVKYRPLPPLRTGRLRSSLLDGFATKTPERPPTRLHRSSLKALNRMQCQREGLLRGWNLIDPTAARLIGAWLPDLRDLQPDLVLANDFRCLHVAATYARSIEGTARRPRIVYDAHEHVPGLAHFGEARLAVAVAQEASEIREADAVVTVDDRIAELLQTRHGLLTTPKVVRNHPEFPGSPVSGPNLRERVGAPPDRPMIVYSGSVGPTRNLMMLVEALPHIPDALLTFVTSRPKSPPIKACLRRAGELDVADRVRLARFVPDDQIVSYLGTADIGVIPFRRNPNNDVAIPTKAREYAVAGVPIVTAGTPALARFVRENGIGEVHEVDDPLDFARAIRVVLEAPERYREPLARVAAESTWDTEARVLSGVLEECLGAKLTECDDAVSTEDTGSGGTVAMKKTKVGVGPQNGRDLAWMLREGASALPTVELEGVEGILGAHAPTEPPSSAPNPLDLIAERCSSLMMVSAASVTGHGNDDEVVRQITELEQRGVRVAIAISGAEVLPAVSDRLAEDHEARIERRGLRRSFINYLGVPVLATSVEAVDVLGHATWMPVPLAPEWFTFETPPFSDSAGLRIVDARIRREKRRNPDTARAIEDVAQRSGATLIDLWSVPKGDQAALVRAADIVIDTLEETGYSYFGTIALSTGRVVLGSVGECWERLGLDPIPMWHTTHIDVAHQLEQALRDRDRAAELALDGHRFATKYHSGDETLAALGHAGLA